MESEEELVRNIRSFCKSAAMVCESGDHTSAFILYFKALVALADLMLVRETGRVPTNHADRFAELTKFDPALHRVLDKYFHFYRKSYSSSIGKGLCDEVSYYVRLFAKKFKVDIGA